MMNITDIILKSIELLGVAAFGIAGAFEAIKKKADAFGVVFLGITTAVGGGVMRDVILGINPPRIFSDWIYVAVAAAAALAVFFFAFISNKKFTGNMDKIDHINNIFDAVGVGLFAVYGAKTVIDMGYTNILLIIFVSMITGTGGGMLRDVIISEVPFILKKHIYALAAILGGVVYYLMIRIGLNEILSISLGAVSVFVLRMLATHYRWNLPHINISS